MYILLLLSLLLLLLLLFSLLLLSLLLLLLSLLLSLLSLLSLLLIMINYDYCVHSILGIELYIPKIRFLYASMCFQFQTTASMVSSIINLHYDHYNNSVQQFLSLILAG